MSAFNDITIVKLELYCAPALLRFTGHRCCSHQPPLCLLLDVYNRLSMLLQFRLIEIKYLASTASRTESNNQQKHMMSIFRHGWHANGPTSWARLHKKQKKGTPIPRRCCWSSSSWCAMSVIVLPRERKKKKIQKIIERLLAIVSSTDCSYSNAGVLVLMPPLCLAWAIFAAHTHGEFRFWCFFIWAMNPPASMLFPFLHLFENVLIKIQNEATTQWMENKLKILKK